MNIDTKHLPDDPQELKSLLLQLEVQHEEQKNQYEEQKNEYKKQLKDERFKYQLLEEKFLALQSKFFGRSSEKLNREDRGQLKLFNEAEMHSDTDVQGDNESEITEDEVTVKGHTRKKRGRKPLPEELPREEIIHDLSDEERKCCFCQENRPRIGKEETEELDIIPAQIKVLKHIRIKYGPCKCEKFLGAEIPEVKTASMPARIIPHSIVSPGLLSYVVVSKYVDALPFYRQSKMFERIDVNISRATLCNWAIKGANRCKDLIALMWEEIRSGPLINMDETTVQVLKEENRDPTSKSYMWITVGYSKPVKPVILFDYHTSRSKDIPVKLLEGYKGYLQTDGYAGYNKVGSDPDIVHIGCFAHARRYFHEAFKLSKKSKTAQRGLSFIQKLYGIEKKLRKRLLDEELTADEFTKQRREKSVPVLEDFHKWLKEKVNYVPPESKTGKAIDYTLKQWDRLIKYMDAYFLTPDNNIVENAIRPFVLGRKNWLFSDTPQGAEASAILYSLVETAKANNLEPYRYLRYLFTHLPQASSKNDLKKLLPTRLNYDVLQTV